MFCFPVVTIWCIFWNLVLHPCVLFGVIHTSTYQSYCVKVYELKKFNERLIQFDQNFTPTVQWRMLAWSFLSNKFSFYHPLMLFTVLRKKQKNQQQKINSEPFDQHQQWPRNANSSFCLEDFVCVCVCVCVSFRMVLCVGCF